MWDNKCVTDASGFGGTFRAAVRAGTVGVVESTGPMGASVRFTGYFDHPLGLPMVMERAHYEIWDYWRRELGPVQRILPTGEYAGPEESVLLMADAASTPPPARMSSALDVSSALARDVPSLEVPFASLECSNGTAWQPVSEATAKRRQAMAEMEAQGALPAAAAADVLNTVLLTFPAFVPTGVNSSSSLASSSLAGGCTSRSLPLELSSES